MDAEVFAIRVKCFAALEPVVRDFLRHHATASVDRDNGDLIFHLPKDSLLPQVITLGALEARLALLELTDRKFEVKRSRD